MTYFDRGNAKYVLENYHGAIDDYTNATELKPDYAEAYRMRGMAKGTLGDGVEGCADLKRAAELGSAKAIDAYRMICK